MIKEAAAAVFVVLLPGVWSLDQSAFAAGASRATLAQASQDAQEQTKGMEAVGQACIQCHNLRFLPLERRTAERWRKTVYEMISRGAQVKPDEIEPIVGYLAATFSPQSPSTQPAAGQAQSRPENLPEGRGRAVLMARCVTCHAVDVAAKIRQSREQWVETIRKMRGLGAVLPADDEAVLTAYLAEHFGPDAR